MLGHHGLIKKWLLEQHCLFAATEAGSVSIFDLPAARLIAFPWGCLGRESWRVPELMPQDRPVFVVTDCLDWRVYIRGDLCAEMRSLPGTNWEPPAGLGPLLQRQRSNEVLAFADALKGSYSQALIKEWAPRMGLLRLILASNARADRISREEADTEVWDAIIGIFQLRLREAACGLFDGSPTSIFMRLKRGLRCYPIHRRNLLPPSFARMPDDSLSKVLEPFVLNGAGPLLGAHLGLIYEEALAHRISSRGEAKLEVHAKKRQDGVYYTPADLVAFMCHKVLGPKVDSIQSAATRIAENLERTEKEDVAQLRRTIGSLRILDPSVGGGEFLRQALNSVAQCYERTAEILRSKGNNAPAIQELLSYLSRPKSLCLARNVYGLDIDPRAARLCALNLVSAAADELHGSKSAWDRSLKAAQRNILHADTIRSAACDFSQKRGNMARPFPRKFSAVLSNPPYRRLSPVERDEAKALGYQTSSAGDLYALFVEASLAMLQENGCFGVVVPLSLSFSENMRPVRALLAKKVNRIEAFHFDNMPDTIFRAGKPENQNTNKANSQRASVLICYRTTDATPRVTIHSSDLLRWRSAERPRLFQVMATADVSESFQVDAGIPKVGAKGLLPLLRATSLDGERLGSLLVHRGRAKLYLPSTARYFIAAVSTSLRRSGEIELSFSSVAVRAAALVALNSSIFYWFWRVWGDGFHVTRKNIEEFRLPSSWVTGGRRDDLLDLAEKLEAARTQCGVSKLNAGKVVRNVNFNLAPDLMDEIDRLYLMDAAIPLDLLGALQRCKRASLLDDHPTSFAAAM